MPLNRCSLVFLYRFGRLVVIFLGALCACRAEDITVRVISAKTGHPITEAHVQLLINYPAHHGDNSSPSFFDQWAYTDNSGSAVFHVSSFLPDKASLKIGGAGADWCSPGTYLAAEVLRSGVSIAYPRACPHRPIRKILVPARPGQIVIYIGQYSRWERSLYFPWFS